MNMKEQYHKEAMKEIKRQFGLKNDLEVPRIEKVVVNIGVGKYLKDSGIVQDIAHSLALITGQKPLMTKSKKSIAGFKVREGQEVGMKVTLRGKRKWDFLEKLVGATIPRIRDFQGIKESAVDANGNLNVGLKEHVVFPEIVPESVKNITSLQVTVTTTAGERERGLALFKALKFPISHKE